jgi:hypothetical protein
MPTLMTNDQHIITSISKGSTTKSYHKYSHDNDNSRNNASYQSLARTHIDFM